MSAASGSRMALRIALASFVLLATTQSASAERARTTRLRQVVNHRADTLKDVVNQLAPRGSIKARHTMRADPDADRLVSKVSVKSRRLGGWKPVAVLVADHRGAVTIHGAGRHYSSFFAMYQDGRPAAAKLKEHDDNGAVELHAAGQPDHGASLQVDTAVARLGIRIDWHRDGRTIRSDLSKKLAVDGRGGRRDLTIRSTMAGMLRRGASGL